MLDSLYIENLKNKFVDPEVGLIQEIVDVPFENGLPTIYRSIAIRNGLYSESQTQISPECNGYGYSFIKNKAQIRALGEAIERYSGSIQIQSNIYATVRDMRCSKEATIIEPKEYWHYSKNDRIALEFPANDKMYHWTTARCAHTSQRIFLPESMIYYRYINNRELLCEDDTCGLACGTSIEDAVLRGLMESLERDAFGIYWLLSIVPIPIDIFKIGSDRIEYILNELKEYEIWLKLYLLKMDHCLPCFAIIMGNNTNPMLPNQYVALRAGYMNPNLIIHLIEEALGGYISLARIYYERKSYPKSGKDITTLEDHALYYGKSNYRLTDCLWPTSQKKDPGLLSLSSKNSLKGILLGLRQIGIRVIYKDLTTKDVESSGLKIVRVISPDLYRLHNLYPRIESPRIEKMRKYFNLNSDKKLNMKPHPFA